MKAISLGIDSLPAALRRRRSRKRRKERVAILCHPSSVDSRGEHLQSICEAEGELVALFGPQHGIHGETQDNMIEWQDTRDSSGRPVYSLYGERRRPSESSLDGVELVVIDLFDVGARYYTFVYTMAYMLEACGQRKIEVIICDRPNPIGGTHIEGPLLDLHFRSFVGLFPIPICHGLTIGELALLFAESLSPSPKIEVLCMRRWKRGMHWPETGKTWTLPSPNMPSYSTAILYPGLCLLEATSLSEGRGTTRPFELIGAPFIDWTAVEAEYMALTKKLALRPAHFHRQGFIPTFHKYSGSLCRGALQIVSEPKRFRPVRHMAILLWILRRQYGRDWAWKDPPYEYEYQKLPIDILAGGPDLRTTIDQQLPLKDLFRLWKADETSFQKSRRAFLKY